MYMLELLKCNYKFNLLELIKEIFNDTNDFSLFKDSLYKIEDLIKEIKNGLRELNVSFYINPFDNIKIKDYIAVFEKLKDCSSSIDDIKKTITYLAEMIDNMEKANSEFLLSIGNDTTILKEDINTIYMSISNEDAVKEKEINEILEPTHLDNPKDNQIIKIANLRSRFMIDRVKEKTNMVIKRVYNMFCEDVRAETTPQLIIEKKTEEPIIQSKNDDLDLFQEVDPFTEPQLFDDRQDGGIFNQSVDKEMKIDLSNSQPVNAFREQISQNDTNLAQEEFTMPDLFWVPKQENNEHGITYIYNNKSY